MTLRVCVYLVLSAVLVAQEPPPFGAPPPNREVPAPNVSFDRIQQSNKEPQNWLTYSGGLMSQRHSLLTAISPRRMRATSSLKWVFQSRSLEKHRGHAAGRGRDDVHDPEPERCRRAGCRDRKARSGPTQYKPDPAAKNCCGRLSRGAGDLGRHALSGRVRRPDDRDRRQDRQGALEHRACRRSEARLRLHASRRSSSRTRSSRAPPAANSASAASSRLRREDRQGSLALQHRSRPRRSRATRRWSGDSWKHGGAPIWVTGSYDPETNLTYWGTGNPGPDWNGAARLGDNLYSCSVDRARCRHRQAEVALPVLAARRVRLGRDAGSGARRYRLAGPAAQSDAVGESQRLFYVLDRTTGEFLLGKPFVKSELGGRLRREGPADACPRHGSDEGRHAGLSRQSGRNELV